MTGTVVELGRYRSPFYPRQEPLDRLNRWHEWKGYSSASGFYDTVLEYFATRNSAGVFDITPMTKYRITGPDALDFLGDGAITFLGLLRRQQRFSAI